MKNITKATIAKIKKQGIVPEPHWKFLVKKYSIWTIFLAAVLSGAISFAIAFDMLLQLDWDLHRFVHQSAILYSLSLLPYVWIVLLIAFLSFTFFDLRRTENGYRFSLLKMSLLSLGGIIFTGIIFLLIGWGFRFNAMVAKGVPYYGQHMMTKQSQWMQVDKGLLSGTIISIADEELEISDLNEKKWKILLGEDTLIRPAANMQQGKMIKIIGTKKDGDIFRAIEIRPWEGRGMMNYVGGQRRGIMDNGDAGSMMNIR
ncbi:MAG: hypothetical protein ACD_56C00146G0007 [uncultured bacterium]|nr:MAG: hypothetical protein ACD_56C00146G0007 [uncultured bacterium]